MKNFVLMLYFILLSVAGLYAQTYPFRTYSIEDGLSESVVNDIIQDLEGYIWLATRFGLNRFDGNSFESYFESNGLNSSNLFSLYQSRDGKIWIGSEKGVNYIDEGSIHTDSAYTVLSNSTVISIFEDSKGGMWFGTDGDGVWHFGSNGKPVLYSLANGFKNNQIRAIAESKDGDLWFATRGGVTRFFKGNIRTYTIDDGLPEDRTRDVVVDDSNHVWIATRNGLATFLNERFESFGQDMGMNVHTLSLSKDGSIWLGTEGGVSQFKEGQFTNFKAQQGLANDIVYSSLIDREGNVWFGTLGGGLSLFLGAYFQNFNTNNGLSNNLVTGITEMEDGSIWIGTYGGGLISYQNDEFQYLHSQHGLLDNRVYHISTDSKNRMWIGMRDGLAIYEKGNIRNFSPHEFPFRKIRHVNEAEDGSFWISTYDEGLIHFRNGEYRQYTTEHGLPSNTVVNTTFDNDGVLWIATYGGVVKKGSDPIQAFTLQDGLPSVRTMSMLKDRDGTIWVSTFDGIAQYDGTQFVAIRVKDGLPGRVCYFIIQDREGIYWVGTNEGIARLDIEKFYSHDPVIKEQGIQVINREHGLIADEVNLGAVYEDSNRNLWFGTVEGVSRFHSSEYRGNEVPPVVHILGLTASGQEFPFSNVELNYDKNYVQINFSAINFTSPNQVTYEYRLHGIDPEWQRTTDRFVKYPSLPPGNFHFQVRAINSNGVWSVEDTPFYFTIKPPYWKTWWFNVLLLATILGILYLFYRNYQYMKMVDIEKVRVRIASDLHDDVGASLTEIALQSDFLQASNLDLALKEPIEHIGKQCRNIVTSLDDIVWSMDARNDTLGDLTDRMQDYILNVLEPKQFNVIYDFKDLKMKNKLPLVIKENLYLIFKESVNNIAKHSNGDEVRVKVCVKNGKLYFYIQDNGRIRETLKKTGQGLRNMQMRAEKMGGILNIDEHDGFKVTLKGTLYKK